MYNFDAAVTRILLIEDDSTLAQTLGDSLRGEGYEVTWVADGFAAQEAIRSQPPDLILMDLMLPGIDGLSLTRLLRQETQVPILMLTARTSEMDKIVGLESGADDYITKPFSSGELLARIRAALRRTPQVRGEVLPSGDLRLDLRQHRAFLQGEELQLSPKEFDLLAELVRNKGTVLTRDFLLERVWGYDFAGDTRTVDVHIRWLREKIEKDPAQPQRIQTVRGLGYRFEA